MSSNKEILMAKKAKYLEKVQSLLAEYKSCFVVNCDNVGSKQIAEVRMALRGATAGEPDIATMLMGKNTMMRKAFGIFLDANPGHVFENLLPKLVGNVGLIFTNSDLNMVAEIIKENKKEAPAKAGAYAPVTVVIPAGPTGADPGATAFFPSTSNPYQDFSWSN